MQPDLCLNGTVRPLVMPEIVVFPVEVAASNVAVVEELLSAFQPGVSVVIADMSATELCDASGIRLLILANNHAACTGNELRVVAPSPAVLRALQRAGADLMLRLYPDVASALTGALQTAARPDGADF